MAKSQPQPAALPTPSSTLGLAALSLFVLLLAVAGSFDYASSSEPSGAMVSVDRVDSIGTGFGLTCSRLASSTRDLSDCCAMMCRPYEDDNFASRLCQSGCRYQGGKEMLKLQ